MTTEKMGKRWVLGEKKMKCKQTFEEERLEMRVAEKRFL